MRKGEGKEANALLRGFQGKPLRIPENLHKNPFFRWGRGREWGVDASQEVLEDPERS